MRFEEIEEEALKLTPDARVKLAHDLVRSLEAVDPAELERLWLDEAERRGDEMDEGRVQSIPGREVFERIRKRLG